MHSPAELATGCGRGFALALAAMLLWPTAVAAQPAAELVVGRHVLPLGSLLGPDLPPVQNACPAPAASPDADGMIAAACGKITAGGDLWSGYRALAAAYLNRGIRRPPPSLSDGRLATASLVAMLRHAPGDAVFADPQTHVFLANFAASMAGAATGSGEATLYHFAADADLLAAATCPAQVDPACPATDRYHATKALLLLGRWRSDPAVLQHALTLTHAAREALPREADAVLWLLLSSRAAEIELELSNQSNQPDEHLALAKLSLAELQEVIPAADSLPHGPTWSEMEQAIAETQVELAVLQHDVPAAEAALARYELAMAADPAATGSVNWLGGQINIGLWHQRLARLSDTSAEWALAALTAEAAIDTVNQHGGSFPLDLAYAKLTHAIALVGEGRATWSFGGRALMQQARDEFASIEPVFIAVGATRVLSELNTWQAYADKALARR